MKEVSLKELLEAGCHFGHQTTRWNPKMRPYIFTARDRIHIFDLVKTKEGLEEAAVLARDIASEDGKIIFVGTKRQAQDIIKEAAKKAGMPYMTKRWVGGLLTNWDLMKKRLSYLADLKVGRAEGRFNKRTKKEILLIDREISKMEQTFGGIEGLEALPAALFVADARKDSSALKEARNTSVKTIAIVDTNSDPDLVQYVIPANDDATKSIQLIVDTIVEAIEEGRKNKATRTKQQEASNKKQESAEKKKAEKAEAKTEEKKRKTKKVAKPSQT